jgi:spermidine synthase
VKPFTTVATARTPDGAELTLHGHDGQFYLRLNRQPLMGTHASASEKALGDLGCQQLRGKAGASVLIGGLGFGFTLKRVLELIDAKAVVHVAELLPEIVAWNREFLGAINGTLPDDPRVTVFIEDVFDVLKRSSPGS